MSRMAPAVHGQVRGSRTELGDSRMSNNHFSITKASYLLMKLRQNVVSLLQCNWCTGVTVSEKETRKMIAFQTHLAHSRWDPRDVLAFCRSSRSCGLWNKIQLWTLLGNLQIINCFFILIHMFITGPQHVAKSQSLNIFSKYFSHF